MSDKYKLRGPRFISPCINLLQSPLALGTRGHRMAERLKMWTHETFEIVDVVSGQTIRVGLSVAVVPGPSAYY